MSHLPAVDQPGDSNEIDTTVAHLLAKRAATSLQQLTEYEDLPYNIPLEISALKDLAAALILVKASVDGNTSRNPQNNGTPLGVDSDNVPVLLPLENTHDSLRVFAFNNEFLISVKQVNNTHDSSPSVGTHCSGSEVEGGSSPTHNTDPTEGDPCQESHLPATEQPSDSHILGESVRSKTEIETRLAAFTDDLNTFRRINAPQEAIDVLEAHVKELTWVLGETK